MVNIVDLKKAPEHLSILANWHQREWGHLYPGRSLKDRVEKMSAYLNDDLIPSTFVAFEGEVKGSAAIVESDMETRTNLSPWLASVFVKSDFRKKGIGSALVRYVMKAAKKADIKELYLFTEHNELFYKRLGWIVFENILYHNQPVTIMKVNLMSNE